MNLQVNSLDEFLTVSEDLLNTIFVDTYIYTVKENSKTVEEAKKYILRDVQDVIEYYKNINDEINLIKLKKIIDWIGEY